ncbi:MAG: hypothetical protein JNN28_09220 [Saprospiraceae bacterium]|nr:hypothetical protein [Saprospiraceae bacterium]
MMPTTKAETRIWLEAQILAEHSKAQTMRMVRWVGHDPERLEVLMEIFLNDPPSKPLPEGRGYQFLYTQRSAWAVRYVAEKAPEMMRPWLDRLISNLEKEPLHDAIKRNTLNVFEHIDFPPQYDESLADLCFNSLMNPQEAIAIRCSSMSILERICTRIPELQPELRLILEEHLEHGSAGFKSRAKKVLSRLNGL